MNIISKFKDYYDGVFFNKDITYDRKQIIYNSTDDEYEKIYNKYKHFLKIENINNSWDSWFGNTINGYFSDYEILYARKYNLININPIVIIFCGKRYLLYSIKSEHINKYIYNIDELKKTIKKIIKYDKLVKKEKKNADRKIKYYENDFNHFYSTNHKYFNDIVENKIICLSLEYSKYNKNNKLIINPCLKDYEFYKLFDSYSAYQELSMYIGGILTNNEDNTTQIPDKDMRDMKGFNKWSFRKPPTKKKRK